MAIPGNQEINIGLQNESADSDSLYVAFHKIKGNFSTLFACASPYTNFIGINGITIDATPATGTVIIGNSGGGGGGSSGYSGFSGNSGFSGAGVPAGASLSLQYNDYGVFGGTANIQYSPTASGLVPTAPAILGTQSTPFNGVAASMAQVAHVSSLTNDMIVVDDDLIPNNSIGLGLFRWGGGIEGRPYSFNTPTQVGLLSNWTVSSLSTSKGTIEIVKTDGTLWSWGNNSYGQLGLGNRTYYESPVQVGSLSDWATVSAGTIATGGIKTDGSLWMWGLGGTGQLGLNNQLAHSSPMQVGLDLNWSTVSVGSSFTIAVKTDNTLWSWGSNYYGQLGLGSSGNYAGVSSPTQVGLLTDWLRVSAGYEQTAAVKTDGTLWTWGGNWAGQLGLGDTVHRHSPVQVGALTAWSKVSIGNHRYGSSTAIQSDGSLWTWGANVYGTLGLGNVSSYSSPMQVGALTNWSDISIGYQSIGAIKTDGTIWTWGKGGPLGHGYGYNESSPVQVGLATWSHLSVGGAMMSAISTITSGAPINIGAVAQPFNDVFGTNLSVTGVSTLNTVTTTDLSVVQYTETVFQMPLLGSHYISFSDGTIQRFTTAGDIDLYLPAAVPGKTYVVMIEYGGANSVTFHPSILGVLSWPGGVVPTPTSVLGKVDIYTFMCDINNVTYGRSDGSNFFYSSGP